MKKLSEKVKGIPNPDDEPDLLDTCPPEQKRSPPSMVMNSGFGKMSSADNKLNSVKTKK